MNDKSPAPEPRSWLSAHKEVVVGVLSIIGIVAGAALTPFFSNLFNPPDDAPGPKQDPVVSRVDLLVHNPYGKDYAESTSSVRCPITVKLSGMISVSEGSGTVVYEFVRKEGLSGREQPVGSTKQVVFSGPGTKCVEDQITVNIPSGIVSYEEALRVISPQSAAQRSQPVKVVVMCDANLPPEPPFGPPIVEGANEGECP